MKTYTFLLVLFCFFAITTSGQNRKRFELDKKEVKTLEKQALENDLTAYFRLALHHQEKGFNTGETTISNGENLKKAEKYLQKAIHYSSIAYKASFQVQRDVKGNRIDPNIVAKKRKKSQSQYGRALYSLGSLYKKVNKYTLAKTYFEKSTELDYYLAYSSLGAMYEKGTGVSVNPKKAIILYEQSYKLAKERRKVRPAQKIGMIYLEIFKDYKNAALWLEKAVSHGSKSSSLLEHLEKAKALITSETNAVNANPVIQSKIVVYQHIKAKAENTLATLQEALVPIKKRKDNYYRLLDERASTIENVKTKNAALNQPKSEFETQKEYESRKQQYNTLVENSTKGIDAKIEALLKPYVSKVRKNYTAEKALKNEYYTQEKKVNEQKKLLQKINKGIPKTTAYKDHAISAMDYMAEEERFKIVMDLGFLNADNNTKSSKKTYYVNVPRDKAQHFKQNKSSYKYFYYLGDLQAIIAQDTTYSIEPIYTWYTKIACDNEDEEAVLVINNTQDTSNITSYLEKFIINKADFIKEAKYLQESYLSDYTKGVRAEISIVFNEKGNYKHTVIEYMKDNRFAPENLHRDGSDKQGGAKGSFLYSIDDIMKKENIKIQPPTKQCEPQSSFFTFDYTITQK